MTFIAPAQPRGSTDEPARSRLGRVGGIELVQWPSEDERRAELAALGRPCLLVLGPDQRVPVLFELEDWVREPLEADEVAARCAALVRRSRCGAPPTLDDGLLLHGGAWAAVPPAQEGMVELLIARIGSVVNREELAAAATRCGGSGNDEAVKAAMARLGRRLEPLGLALRCIRGRGYLLETDDACPLHGTRSAADAKG